MTQSQDSLSRLTLRQLRLKASELGVPLYSRKSKASLVKSILLAEARLEAEKKSVVPFWRAPSKPTQDISTSRNGDNTRVVFLPRDPEWAYVFWEINESDRKQALSHGASRLSLRLADVTGINDGRAHPHTLQEIQVDSHSTEWYLPIPMSDRDYRVELGYVSRNRWISLAFSAAAKVPSLHPSDQILDQFVPFSLDAPANTPTTVNEVATDLPNSGLHEKLYQSATTHFRKSRIGSEEFQENFRHQPSGLSDSGAGIWASGRNDSGIGGVLPRQRSFWLVADAELVVYGATDPTATVTIGGEQVPLSTDGTFRLQVPFRDGVQKYPIEASITNGEQTRNIIMQFERSTPVDNTNPSDHVQSEWF